MAQLHRKRGLLTGALLTTLVFSSVWADAPLPPPSHKTIASANNQFVADMDPDHWMTTIYHIKKNGKKEKQWAMIGWFQVAYLSDDGNHLAAGFPGLNLLPRNYRKDEVMIHFIRRGEVIHMVTLDDLIKNFKNLKKTVSHYEWGHYRDLNKKGQLVVETVENRTFVFDITSGKRIR